ncbi:MAG: response regulator [Chloroflexota bacterium]|nr:response regulator [Chloroflexota bacterium]
MSASKLIRVLCMEDNAGLARLLQKRLERQGYLVELARNGEEGLSMYDAGSYDIVVVDQVMPIYTGLEVIRVLANRGPLPPIIMVTGTGSEQIAVEAMKLGAGDYLVKDVNGGYLDLLPTVIEQVLNQQRLVEEKQQAEESLRQYAAELETRNEELDAFAHTVAHDLKSPLCSILGFAEMLEEWGAEMSDEEVSDSLRLIVEGGRKINSIIDELLLLASVRKQDVELEPLPMASIVAVTLKRLSPLIGKYQAEISLPDTWPVAVGYNPWIEEVWVNYLGNAIKYGGRPPRVELGAGPLASGREVREGMECFWVRDNGAGLTPEEQARLFTPFTRLDQVRVEGHGLGLSIVQRIIEKLGGQFGVESEVGRGSVFYFTLSCAEAS